MKRKDGFIIVEAVFIVTMTFLVLSILMGFAFIIYQQTNIVVTANDVATKIAAVYNAPSSEPFTGYYSLDDISTTPLYSYMFEDSAFFGLSEPLAKSSYDKAEWLALAQLDNSAIIKAKSQDIDVEIIKRPYQMVGGSYIITVNLKQVYDVPGAFAFRFFGVPNEVEFTATGTALFNDMMHRMNTIDTQVETVQYVEDNLFGLKTATGVIDAVKQLADTLTSWLKLSG